MNSTAGRLRTLTETITLTCRHTYLGPHADPGVEYYCRRCGRLESVVTSCSRWSWSCSTCGRKRTYNSRRLYGETMAMHHHQQTGHKVVYTDSSGRVLWESHPLCHTQLELPIEEGECPF